MINFYNYFNFYYFFKKNIFNILLCLLKNHNILNLKNILIFLVKYNSTKTDIKNSIEYFLGIKILKVNTLILKKTCLIKKSFIYFNDFI